MCRHRNCSIANVLDLLGEGGRGTFGPAGCHRGVRTLKRTSTEGLREVTRNDASGRVTQRVSLEEVEGVLPRQARAAVAFAGPDGPECVPVLVRGDGDLYIGLCPDPGSTGGLPDRVVLVVDDGRYWFELRAAVRRGTVTPVDLDRTGASGADGLVWLRFQPLRVVAWDYGRLREEPGR
jgi:hypothetical protein